MLPIITERLLLRHLTPDDAPFILELVNDPDWLRYIGDKNIHTLDDARDYIVNGPMAMYERRGFGLYLVELRETGGPAGICGLIQRDTLPDVDLGFAFLPGFRGRGLALEAAVATLEHGRRDFALARLVAITSLDNDRSGHLLEKAGFRFEQNVRLAAESEEVKLYAWEA